MLVKREQLSPRAEQKLTTPRPKAEMVLINYRIQPGPKKHLGKANEGGAQSIVIQFVELDSVRQKPELLCVGANRHTSTRHG